MSALAVRQGTPEWLTARRSLITATDIPALLNLSPYRCEQDVADDKLGLREPSPPAMRMQVGKALEPVIAAEYSRQTGRKLRRVHGMRVHPRIEWAACSPDYIAVGERLDVEIKWYGGRGRFADGLPQDIEAQVAWQLGVMGYPAADVAVLLTDELRVFHQEQNPTMFEGLLDIAADFRRRLAEGGPFAQSADTLKRRYPADNGAELLADAEVAEAVHALVALRSRRRAMEADEEAFETAIKTRMGQFASLRGSDFTVTWKRTKDVSQVDWKSVADGLLRTLPETERAALVGIATTVRPGFRPFRVVVKGDTE